MAVHAAGVETATAASAGDAASVAESVTKHFNMPGAQHSNDIDIGAITRNTAATFGDVDSDETTMLDALDNLCCMDMMEK
ncbi:hypothetical protein GN958_ATG03928 [Phytophthora infestans]|uniref:Uncharacterized protein n=1 Tax=Phytophthora infestans TaxID=4787 RepID=A0A8S9V0C5_PHYIN|nr:hypothetical protein GN958_ATG03928 [Phytophthora infestans]